MERIKLYVAKNKPLKYVLILCTICFSLYLAAKAYNNIRNDISDTSKGIIGTLLGAVVGGCFTLWGTLIIHKNEQRAKSAIKRKNIIYKPLYDELMIIHNKILPDNPYPFFVEFEKQPQTMLPFPQYTVWGRIKNDARLFEVPPKLNNAIEDLYASIELYKEKRANAIHTLDRIYREEYTKVTKKALSDSANVGSTLLKNVLQEEKPSKDELSWFNNNISDKQLDLLWNEVNRRANESVDFKKLKEAKNIWNRDEEKVIKLLSTYIEYITVKYEG